MFAVLTTEGGCTLAREMTEFGRSVWTLMASRGITTQRELSRLILKHAGEHVSFDVVRNYLYGRSAVPPDFPRQVVAALRLNESEKAALAQAFAFGQYKKMNIERKAS